MAKTIGIIAIKGGVGKTTAVSNLGAVLAHEFNKKVLVVDANFSAANLGLHLGIINPEKTLHEVLADKYGIKDAIHSHDLGFDVLPASIVPKKVDPLKLKSKLAEVKKDYDYILIDSSPALNEEILAAMVASDELLVVTSPDYPTLSCTMHAVKVAKRKGVPITGLVLNKIRGKKFELSIEDIENACNAPVVAVLPDDVRFMEALADTKPGAVHAPMSEAAVEYKKLAAAIAGKKYNDPRLSAKIKKLFIKDIPKQDINRELIGKE